MGTVDTGGQRLVGKVEGESGGESSRYRHFVR
jgi:hypothetical protein